MIRRLACLNPWTFLVGVSLGIAFTFVMSIPA